MALDLSWVACEDCGRKPSDGATGEVSTFTLQAPILCGTCADMRRERNTPKLNACAKSKLCQVLLDLTPLAVAIMVHGKDAGRHIPPDQLEAVCGVMKKITTMVYGPHPEGTKE